MKLIASSNKTSQFDMLKLLTATVDKHASVRNRADAESLDGSMVRFALHGKLERPDKPESEGVTMTDEWYLRAGESYHGPIGIHFPARMIHEIWEMTGGQTEIVLK